MTSGFTAIYFFVYCIHFYATKLEIEGFVSTFLYFGYTFIMCFLFFLLTGNIYFRSLVAPTFVENRKTRMSRGNPQTDCWIP